MRDNGPESKLVLEGGRQEPASVRLSTAPERRHSAIARAFDPVTQTLVTGERESTTVATQTLFLLNSPFVRKYSLAYGEALAADRGRSVAQRIHLAYRQILGRSASTVERKRAQALLAVFAARFEPAPDAPGSRPLLGDAKIAAPPPFTLPFDPDSIDRFKEKPTEERVEPATRETAAWTALVQALYASAEFRFVR